MAPAAPSAPVAEAAEVLRARLGTRLPRTALILGSGLGDLVHYIEDPVQVPYRELPGFPPSAVAGHAGRVVAGRLAGAQVLAFAGRVHLYEGHAAATVALPVRLAHAVGARVLVVSNAAGGIRRTLRPGDLMLIRDHINLTGRNPLVGPVRDGETRFPDMSAPYDAELLLLLREAALAVGVPVVEGVYVAVLGPSYETPAEIRMLERLGADAVGMSTVPEVIAARALGMRVAGVSCITNPAAGIAAAPLSHADVLATSARVADAFVRLMTDFVRRLPR
ncbi:MAG: purine-nucleoside phosphorylase [Gemmatimonadaceae bacterium]|nr:purine-nucleoside phosphorylase [Gemmatimonadaceae bacterium]